MKRRALRALALIWLGWYLSGPLGELVDFWDTPPEELRDIVQAAGGLVALVSTGLAVVISQVSKLRERFRLITRSARGMVHFPSEPALPAPILVPFHPPHSPPVPLRI